VWRFSDGNPASGAIESKIVAGIDSGSIFTGSATSPPIYHGISAAY
jgi:hypothetical protein